MWAYILCTIYLAICYDLHIILLTLLHHLIITMAMTGTGFLANESTNLQTPSFKYAFVESNYCKRGQ